MAEFSRLVITSKGQALIAKIMMGKGNIAFTKVSASNAEYVLEQLESLTELDDIRQNVPVSKISRTNEVAITIEAVFHNLELTEGYHMRALGLYATDPDEGEILYAVTTEISGNCYMPAYNGIAVSEAYIKLVTTVGNSESVSLEVDLAAVVTVGDMNSLRKEIVETYLPKTGDSSDNIVTFESDDSKNVTSWTDVPVMESKEKHKSLFKKVSTMIKNVRFLYEMLNSKVNITSLLETIEQVDANTSAENIANALVIKALKAELMNSINQINSKLTSIGTVVTGNAIEKTISVAYGHDSISETISLIPGTYIFIIRVEYKIATDRSVLVALVQDDNWNVMSWAFTTEGQSPSVYGGVSAKSYVFALQINSNHSYKVEIGINWLTEGDNNAAKALLQAIRIA